MPQENSCYEHHLQTFPQKKYFTPFLKHLSIKFFRKPEFFEGNQLMSSAEPRIVWSLTNQQEASWRFAQISFTPDNPYLLTFEGVRASNVLGVLGLDDIVLYPGPCSPRPPPAIVNTGDCSFELDTCGWKAINPGGTLDLRPQDWKLADRNQNFGTIRDHTFKLDTNGYLYFDTLNIPTKTWLISPRLPANVSLCLQFYFATTSSLTSDLQIRRQFSNGTMGALWGVKYSDLELPVGSTMTPWLPAQVFISALSSDSAIVFEGNANDGGFALDDITVTPTEPTSCETRPRYKSSSETRTNAFQFAGLQSSHSRFKDRRPLGGLQSLSLFRDSKSLDLKESPDKEDDESSVPDKM